MNVEQSVQVGLRLLFCPLTSNIVTRTAWYVSLLLSVVTKSNIGHFILENKIILEYEQKTRVLCDSTFKIEHSMSFKL